ncbi:hypothetical protein [Carbonactinospora thermoautotrophica]|uniref:hypothetical protein n=1 Tax=Carbonactinospora thermoautotrophica TaxID=1469144 RepID=UPI00082BBF64|nr:hypothetical protein [Carbonactinospora thermoautotrophica]
MPTGSTAETIRGVALIACGVVLITLAIALVVHAVRQRARAARPFSRLPAGPALPPADHRDRLSFPDDHAGRSLGSW